MAIVVGDEVLDYLRVNSGGIVLRVTGAPDPDAVRAGLTLAVRRIGAIRHPEEPDEPYASFLETTGSELRADMADAEAYDGILEEMLNALVTALHDAGVDEAVITPVTPATPAAPAPEPEPAPAADEPATPKRAFQLPDRFPIPDDIEAFQSFDIAFDDGRHQFETDRSLEDVVDWYLDALPAAGFEVTAREPARVRWSDYVRADGINLRWRGRGWKGTVSASAPAWLCPPAEIGVTGSEARPRRRVYVHLYTDLTPDQLKRDSGVEVTQQRRNAYLEEALSATRFLIGPDDISRGPWVHSYWRVRTVEGCFCSEDVVLRKGPNKRPGTVSAVRWLLQREGQPLWLDGRVDRCASADAARREWAWVEPDLKKCRTFSGTTPLGEDDVDGRGTWSDLTLPGAPADTFAAELIFETNDGRRVVGRKVLIFVDRFIARLYLHGLEPVDLPDLGPLIELASARLRAVAERFPPLTS